jgi:hypothetical protein
VARNDTSRILLSHVLKPLTRSFDHGRRDRSHLGVETVDDAVVSAGGPPPAGVVTFAAAEAALALAAASRAVTV